MIRHAKSFIYSILKSLLILLLALSIAVIVRLFFISMYIITSRSMEPTLMVGDFIVVSKINFGPRFIRLDKFYKQKKIQICRIKGLTSIKKGDVIVFNRPGSKTLNESIFVPSYVVKRCFSLPGDSVVIRSDIKGLFSKRDFIFPERNTLLYPNDSMLSWSLDNYGPLYVPAKGNAIKLENKNVNWYKDILTNENPNFKIEDSVVLNENAQREFNYTFKHNYYFMLGDNFYNSYDSRYWGFVPDDNIVGKAVLVLFSIDKREKGFKKIRWERVMKRI